MQTLKEQLDTLSEKETFQLIKGQFSPEEAYEVLSHLISEKINFHQSRNFSSQIRFGMEDKDSLGRIDELTLTKKLLEAFFLQAKDKSCSIKIGSDITLELIPNSNS